MSKNSDQDKLLIAIAEAVLHLSRGNLNNPDPSGLEKKIESVREKLAIIDPAPPVPLQAKPILMTPENTAPTPVDLPPAPMATDPDQPVLIESPAPADPYQPVSFDLPQGG